MVDENIIYKILRYLLEGVILYLVLRYTPYITLDTTKAVILALILTIFLIVVENLVMYYCMRNNIPSESFKNQNCDACKVEPKVESFEQPKSDPANSPKCRIVCDGDNDNKSKVEGFNGNGNENGYVNGNGNGYVNGNGNGYVNGNGNGEPFYYWGQPPDTFAYDTRGDYAIPRNIGADKPPLADIVQDDFDRQKFYRDQEFQARTVNPYSSAYQEPGSESQLRRGIEIDQRIGGGPLEDELKYSDYNSLPVAAGYKSHAFEYGYSFLPPERWYPEPVRAPICVTDRRSPICPVLSSNSVADLKDFYTATRITPPMQINVAYIKEKLNVQ